MIDRHGMQYTDDSHCILNKERMHLKWVATARQ